MGTLRGSARGFVASGEKGSCLVSEGGDDFLFSVVCVPVAECVVLINTGSINSFLNIDRTFLLSGIIVFMFPFSSFTILSTLKTQLDMPRSSARYKKSYNLSVRFS